MNFKKKFDYSDINNFLPDNITLGNSEYFDNKFNNKLLDGYSLILEAKSRQEYSEDDVQVVVDDVMKKQQEYIKQLLFEFDERAKEGLNVNNNNDSLNITFENKKMSSNIIINNE